MQLHLIGHVKNKSGTPEDDVTTQARTNGCCTCFTTLILFFHQSSVNAMFIFGVTAKLD